MTPQHIDAFISVIIPMYNDGPGIKACLENVLDSDYSNFEVIVVDDGSTDQSIGIVKTFPCQIIILGKNRGAAAARNSGAKAAQGEILFFLDADILVEKNTLKQVAQSFRERPGISALFCSYQKDTVPGNFFSIYKNYIHHYTHQISQEEAATFCAGYGAMKKDVFSAIGGFNEDYRSLEDIELGYRLHQAGYRIFLNKRIQLTHSKHYTFWNLVKSDVLHRAIPWTKIMLHKKIYRADLNVKGNNIFSVVAAYLILCVLPLLGVYPKSAVVFIGLWVALFLLNYDFYRFVFRERGWFFTVQTILMNWFTYLYSGVGLGLGIIEYLKDLWSKEQEKGA